MAEKKTARKGKIEVLAQGKPQSSLVAGVFAGFGSFTNERGTVTSLDIITDDGIRIRNWLRTPQQVASAKAMNLAFGDPIRAIRTERTDLIKDGKDEREVTNVFFDYVTEQPQAVASATPSER